MISIKELRERKNLTQQQLANLIGISKKTISAYETGKAVPSLRVALKLSKILEVPVEELFEFSNSAEV